MGAENRWGILETVLFGIARPEWHITPCSHLASLLHRAVDGEKKEVFGVHLKLQVGMIKWLLTSSEGKMRGFFGGGGWGRIEF